ncbi:hypothetical protein H4219_004923 [Mycoemilia scoparia]|uniref:Uncharacterized protein n=1 Tax=Mycoemilia scoparia TaxID=417184 RepID=A0A9W7ZQ11_9FUNG|nr:hypothetical protein H4219_004923 [Mycoemilia scoparia]
MNNNSGLGSWQFLGTDTHNEAINNEIHDNSSSFDQHSISNHNMQSFGLQNQQSQVQSSSHQSLPDYGSSLNTPFSPNDQPNLFPYATTEARSMCNSADSVAHMPFSGNTLEPFGNGGNAYVNSHDVNGVPAGINTSANQNSNPADVESFRRLYFFHHNLFIAGYPREKPSCPYFHNLTASNYLQQSSSAPQGRNDNNAPSFPAANNDTTEPQQHHNPCSTTLLANDPPNPTLQQTMQGYQHILFQNSQPNLNIIQTQAQPQQSQPCAGNHSINIATTPTGQKRKCTEDPSDDESDTTRVSPGKSGKFLEAIHSAMSGPNFKSMGLSSRGTYFEVHGWDNAMAELIRFGLKPTKDYGFRLTSGSDRRTTRHQGTPGNSMVRFAHNLLPVSGEIPDISVFSRRSTQNNKQKRMAKITKRKHGPKTKVKSPSRPAQEISVVTPTHNLRLDADQTPLTGQFTTGPSKFNTG